ncbi:MAG: hypothetical protein ACYSUT_01265 [Planctomycetota bacterium]
MKRTNQLCIALAFTLGALLTGCSTPGNPDTDSQQQTSSMRTAQGVITADCIVGYYCKRQAPYITEQQYHFDIPSGKLQIIATEPSGTYTFTLNKEQFSQSRELTRFLSDLPAGFGGQQLSTIVYYSFAASAGLLETGSLESGDNLKLEGRWYQPLQATWPKQDNRVILLKNLDNNRINAAGIAQFDTNATVSDDAMDSSLPVASRWLAKSYNFRYNNELDRLLPRKIDIFDIQKGIASKKLMIQIELKTVRQGIQSAE